MRPLATMNSPTPRNLRADLLEAAVGLLNDHGPDALQTRKVATAAATSTMAVYTHFGGMRDLIAAVADLGFRQFDAALSIPQSDDPVADLLLCGMAYRQFATDRPHLYRLMFGSTSAHGINAPSGNVLAVTVAEIHAQHPSFAHVVRHVHRCILASRITVAAADDDAAVLRIAAQFWTMMHGFVMLELAGYFGADGSAIGAVLGAMGANTLIALGDDPPALSRSQAALANRLTEQKSPGDR